MLLPVDFLNYGALGAALLVLLIAVGVLLRVLQFSRDIFAMTLDRIETNTAALVRLSERLHGGEEEQ
jgi:hypothetical protein